MNSQKFTPQQALPKAKHYCAYQERCHSEVRDKLYGFGLNTKEVDQIISTLIEENYLNEERFAIQFTGGHFRSKKWGRVKIRYELLSRGIPENIIPDALKEIDEAEYLETIRELIIKKQKEIKAGKNLNIREKIITFVNGKGFESDLVAATLNELKI